MARVTLSLPVCFIYFGRSAFKAPKATKTDYLGGNFVPNEKVAPQFADANEEATY